MPCFLRSSLSTGAPEASTGTVPAEPEAELLSSRNVAQVPVLEREEASKHCLGNGEAPFSGEEAMLKAAAGTSSGHQGLERPGLHGEA